MMYDVIFHHAMIFNGLGDPPYEGALAVRGDAIAEVGPGVSGSAHREVDARGLALSPGFVDIHGHSDYYLLINPEAHAKVRQGVTTDVGGNCGYAASPIRGAEAEERKKWYREQFDLYLPFQSVGEHLDHVDEVGVSINYAHLVGHNTIRASVMGGEARPARAEELAAMEEMLSAGMEQGAFGLSTGLVYAPACFADQDELTALCRVSARGGGLLATHMRSEGDALLDAMDEVMAAAASAGLPLQISHLKTAGERNWDKLDEALDRIERARARGEDVTCDRYPYTASNTHLSALLPDWAHDGAIGEKMKRLANADTRAKIRDEITQAHPESSYWENILISRVFTEANQSCEGLTLARLGDARNTAPVDAMLDLLIEESMNVEILIFMMSPENMRRILQKPYVMVGSDAGALSHEPPLGAGRPHPRNFGTFPFVLGALARDEGLFPMAEAIRKMTSAPCARLGMADRGRLAVGMKADLVLFDPDEIRDECTYESPIAYPSGIEMVLVNGEVVVEGGSHTGARPGRALRKLIRRGAPNV